MSQPATAADLSDLGLDDLEARMRRLEVSLEDLRSLQRARAPLGSLDLGEGTPQRDIAELQRRLEVVELRVAGVEAVTARVHDAERALEHLKTEQLPALQKRVAAAETPPAEKRSPAAEYAIAAAKTVFASSPSETPASTSPASSPWLLVDLWRRFSMLFRMLADRRFSMSWQSKVLIFIMLPLFLTSEYWCPLSWILVIGGWFDKVLKLALAFAAYVAISRELSRYNDFLARQRFG
ncbi:MAG: hypothetical protein U0744_13250 [Gemmataceae bacterium]